MLRMARLVTRPVNTLSEAVKSVEGGDFDNAHQQNAGACRTAQAFVQQLLQDSTPALDVLRANFK